MKEEARADSGLKEDKRNPFPIFSLQFGALFFTGWPIQSCLGDSPFVIKYISALSYSGTCCVEMARGEAA